MTFFDYLNQQFVIETNQSGDETSDQFDEWFDTKDAEQISDYADKWHKALDGATNLDAKISYARLVIADRRKREESQIEPIDVEEEDKAFLADRIDMEAYNFAVVRKLISKLNEVISWINEQNEKEGKK